MVSCKPPHGPACRLQAFKADASKLLDGLRSRIIQVSTAGGRGKKARGGTAPAVIAAPRQPPTAQPRQAPGAGALALAKKKQVAAAGVQARQPAAKPPMHPGAAKAAAAVSRKAAQEPARQEQRQQQQEQPEQRQQEQQVQQVEETQQEAEAVGGQPCGA